MEVCMQANSTRFPATGNGALTIYPMLINGKTQNATASLDITNPATGESFAKVARASSEHINAAVAAAKAAQPGWAARPLKERQAALSHLADYIHSNEADIARALVMEQGKPIAEAAAEVSYAQVFIRWYAGQGLAPQTVQDDEQYRIELQYRPLGVVAGITPWNFPFLIGLYKLAPAVLLGNTFVWKPAPTTPVTALMLAPALAKIFPAGVVNIVVDNNDLGALLTAHPDIAKISFTGSTATGRKVMAASATSLKRLTLELGGNDAGIVLPDADIAKTASRVAGSAFFNAGQVCIALKRLYVHRSIYDKMCDELAQEVSSFGLGNGLEPGTRVGPLQNRKQYDKARHYLDVGRADGRIIVGGEVIDGPGYFMRPTVVRDIADGSALVDDEQFAPILPVIAYDDVEDVVARANSSEYGLGGSIWSKDEDAALALASRIDSGTIWINHHTHFGPAIPFGGAKQSGLGTEFGREGLMEFAQKSVVSLSKQ
jgi:acyl-CoA reductase-like NAD-dependent aldehyde dehydrogenase